MNDPRRRFAIVFDFDGTILPSTPWDSEQELLLARAAYPGLPPAKRLACRLVALGDRRGWLRGSFKRHYLRLLRGTGGDQVARLAATLARRVCPETGQALRRLRERGHRLIVASCGTADLSEAVLRAAGLRELFDELIGNRFVFVDGLITGMDLRVPSPQAKVETLRRRGLSADSTIAVGDGPTDLPLLDWAGLAVVVAHDGAPPGQRLRRGRPVVGSIAEIPEVVRRHGG